MKGPVCFREGHKCSEERESGRESGGAEEYPPGSSQAAAQSLPNGLQGVSTDLPWDKGHTTQPAHLAWLI